MGGVIESARSTPPPPTSRYLTFWALKVDKSSLKSSNIECRFPRSVSRKGKLSNRAHAFMSGQFLPVPILIGLHSIEARVAADSLVHWFVCSTGRAVLQQSVRWI